MNKDKIFNEAKVYFNGLDDNNYTLEEIRFYKGYLYCLFDNGLINVEQNAGLRDILKTKVKYE